VPPQYPVNLTVEGRPCLVVGGGAVARRKVEGLLAAGAEVTVIAPEVDPDLVALPVAVERRPYRAGDASRFRLVIAATDDLARSSFTLPSVARRGPIVVAVSTGGQSPALAAWLRRRIEADLGGEYEVLLRLLSEARDTIKAAGRSTEGVDWPSVLDSNMLELIRAGDIGKARERLEACLSSS